jgi:hypothetical protein
MKSHEDDKVIDLISGPEHGPAFTMRSKNCAAEMHVLIRLYDFATALCPDIPFADIAHHGPNRLPRGQKVIGDAAANIARNTGSSHASQLLRRFGDLIRGSRSD